MNIPMKKQNWNPNENACHSKQNLYENTNENATYRTAENGNQKKRMKQISWFKSTCTLVSEYLEKTRSSIH